MFGKNRSTIEKIKILKSIKADEAFKFDLRKKMIEEGGVVIKPISSRLQKKQGMSILQLLKINPLNKNMFIPLLLVAALLGSGAGVTYASQSSLPGDALYPVKLVSEKAQTVLIIDDAKEANLHLKFSSERLEEVEELAKKGEKNPEHVKLAVDNYKTELAQVQTILNSAPANSAQTTQIAQDITDTVTQNKIILVRVSKDFSEDDDMIDILKEAWEEAIEHSDTATILLLQNAVAGQTPVNTAGNTAPNTTNTTNTNNTTTTPTVTTTTPSTNNTTVAIVDPVTQVRVLNKIAEANHKISEAERYIVKKESKGIDVTQAKAQVATAKTLVIDAQNLLSQVKYSEAFLKAKEAHKTAEAGKKLVENDYKGKNHDEDKDDEDDDEVIFIITSSATTTAPSATTNTSTTPTTVTTPSAPTNQIIIDSKHDDDDKDDNHDDEDEDDDDEDDHKRN